MNLPTLSLKIKRLVSLDMPVEALKTLFLDLAVELDAEEARLSKERGRKTPEVPRKPDGNRTESQSRARVEDNTLPSLLDPTVRKEDPLVIPPSPPKPLPSEPEGFAAFWQFYPKRDGSADRKGAVKAYIAALRRVSNYGIILEGARHFRNAMSERSKIGTEFIPQARTWLNGDRWNERYETPTNGHKPNSITGGFAIIDAAIDREIAQAEARERDGPENPETLPRLRQGDA